MKRIKYYILLLASVGCFSACTSWLDEDPVYSQNNAVVFHQGVMPNWLCWDVMIYDDNRGVWTNVAGTAYHSFRICFRTAYCFYGNFIGGCT